MTQASAKETQSRGINRTICIGLGGTGRDVLMRIRRLIVDRYGHLNKLPIVSFVHIDTDKAATQVTGIRTGSTYHGVDLSFKEAEKVGATMSSRDVTMFVEGLERRSEYSNYGPYDHIGRWFPPRLLQDVGAIEDGAKCIRPVGRLAFFHNYQKIKTSIVTAENRTRGHESFLLKSGLRIEPGLNIFVVGSLCGGTGSGMFLDVAYSLRDIYRDETAKIFAYLVISPDLYGNTNKMITNTYAALKELNYYSTPGTTFEAVYDLENSVIVQNKKEPFDYTYLISNKTLGEYQILTQGKLCNVIAHKIALDFSGELAPVMKSNRDNFKEKMIESDKHPRRNTQRYLTFGLSAIYFPRDTIIEIALTKVGLELVTFWLNGKGQSPDPINLLEQFLIQHNWPNDLGKRDGLTNKLAESVEESNKTFSNTLKTWQNKLSRLIAECKNKDDRTNIRQQLATEFYKQFRTVQPGETESSRGYWLTKLIQATPKITKELNRNIDDYVMQLLTPVDPNFSIKNTHNWLDSLRHELHKYQRDLQESITDFGGIKHLEDIERKWDNAEQTIEDMENKLGIPFVDFKNIPFQEECKKVMQEVYKIIKHNFELTVLQETLKIVNQLQKQVQEKEKQIAAFSSLVEDLESAYEKEERELKQLNFDEMSGEAIFDTEDIELCYQTMIPENDSRPQLILASSEITKETDRGASLGFFLNMERTTYSQLKEKIDLKVNTLFAFRGSNIVTSVIKRFMQKYSLAARSTRLTQIMQEAQPLLRLNLNDPYFRDEDDKSSKLVGSKDIDESDVTEFKKLLTQELGISTSVLKAIQADDEILIVNEYAGFPLRLISSLERMRNPYLREQNSGTSFLHNDYRASFPDIIPPNARRMEELEDIFYPCLALELLAENQDTQELEFKHYDSFQDSYYTAAVSANWMEALEDLANNRNMADTLKQILDDTISQMENNPKLWENEYLPQLRQFADKLKKILEDSPNFPYIQTVYVSPDNIQPTVREGVINRFWKKMEAKFRNTNSLLPRNNTGTQKAIVGEIVSNSPLDNIDNRSRRRQELEQLKQDLDEGFMTSEEYEREKQRIFLQYPL
ncbi:tubulin-like doman-containing protein [Dolichospermum sp. LEGE 00246]|uniref:tubulin-like doman-containing protein n=1 Tax=Dolichospermum sp. LEGE 00246 TaxID=1828605 RepID=UPI001881530E|nr:tubulin-like doman-containing protein [Dolichospermum sp. LEGE 00246]MBE9256365.1 tubulin-like doman-containing protein [Dolichospermum sp. LEGE 00246]